MIYRFSLTIPAGRTKESPLEKEMKLTEGYVTLVEVSFPPGPHGEVHVAIRDGLHQVWPTNPEESFAWDAYTGHFPEQYLLDSAPYTLTLQGWAPDASYDHDIVSRLVVLSREAVEGKKEELGILKRLERLILGR
uniref:Uncharacterized protein n=1 Tax=viral metagenome TaxID=1070528 RepID=A0A6H2A163_9ZZZZ